MTVKQWEQKVLRVEGFRMVVRAPATTKVAMYPFTKGANEGWRIRKFLAQRIDPMLGGYEIAILMANGKDAHGKRNLKSIRESYRRR